MNLAQLRDLAVSVGFPDPDLAAAVAMAESGGNPNAYGDAQYGGSVGLWQINLPSHPGVTASQLYDPTFNAQAAYQISNGGTNWTPWTTYNTGAYKQFYFPHATPANAWGTAAAIVGLTGAIAYALTVKPVRRRRRYA